MACFQLVCGTKGPQNVLFGLASLDPVPLDLDPEQRNGPLVSFIDDDLPGHTLASVHEARVYDPTGLPAGRLRNRSSELTTCYSEQKQIRATGALEKAKGV